MVVLNGGRVEQVGSPLELYHHPANLFVAGFLGTPKMAFLKGQVVATDAQGVEVALAAGPRMRLPRQGAGLAVGSPVTLGIRPEHLRLAADGQLPVITFCHMVTEAEEPLTVRVPGDCAVAYGERQRLALDVEFCHLFDEQGRAVAPLLRQAA